MPNIKTIRAAIAELPKGPPLVIAISGGTTGIGSYIADTFAAAFAKDGAKLRVYIIGRNATRAESVISAGRKTSPGSDWRFIKAADLSLISEVDKACADLIKQENVEPFAGGPPRLDLLYMTHSSSPLETKSIPTSEGLDTFFSTLYYSRIRLITKLVPLLEASPKQAHVISVYAGSMEEVKAGQDPPLGPPSDKDYGMGAVRRNVVFMKCFIFQELASRYQGKISFSHIYPGLVDGPGFYNADNPTWFKILWRVLYPLLWLTYMTSPEDCGRVMAYLATPPLAPKGTKIAGANLMVATDGTKGGGCYALWQRADAQKEGKKAFKAFQGQGFEKKMWDHTMETFERIEKQNAENQ